LTPGLAEEAQLTTSAVLHHELTNSIFATSTLTSNPLDLEIRWGGCDVRV
jgi:hypothetical protein